MAEGTRLRDLNEHMLTLESRMHNLTTEYQDRVVELAAQIKEVSETEQKHYENMQTEAMRRHELILKDSATKHEELLMLLASRNSPVAPVEKTHHVQNLNQVYQNSNGNRCVKLEFKDDKGKGILPNPVKEFDSKEESRSTHHQHTPYPWLEFLTFTGDEPRVWVENCEQYFEVYQIPHHQWLNIATMHMSGRARTWKQSYLVHKQMVSWEEFVESLYRRFAQTGERYLVREFNNLRQFSTVERYQEKFEELKTQLLYYNSQLTEEHLISCYINGLREDLVPFMDIAHPNTLEEAYEQAKLHERALSVVSRRYKSNPRTPGGSYQSSNFYKPQAQATQKYSPNNTQKVVGNQMPYNKSLLEQRRAAG